MIVLGLLVVITTIALRLDGRERPARTVDRLGAYALTAAAALTVLGGGSPVPAIAGAIASASGYASRNRRLQPLPGWTGLWLCGAAASSAASLSLTLSAAGIGLLVASVEFARSSRWRSRSGRSLLLAGLALDLPLAAAIATSGPRLRVLLEPPLLFGSHADLPGRTLIGLGLTLSGLVRIGLVPFAGWLIEASTRRPARLAIAKATYAVTLLPAGVTLVALGSRLIGIGAPGDADPLPIAIAIALSGVSLLLAVRRNHALLAVAAAALLTLAATTGFGTSPRVTQAAPFLAAAATLAMTRTWPPSPAVRQTPPLTAATVALIGLPLGVAANLARFLDWFAVRQTLVKLPRLLTAVRPDGSLGWLAAFGVAAAAAWGLR